ncbi:MAG: hypothetical protein EB075_06300 [Bacteroidetes bacterium]|nr:hypothetical protein [Bacteroidota bacterium]
MGDRNNIKITYSTGDSIYLYGHWIGNEIQDIVRDAMENSGRVTDESYFARVLFSKMIESDIHGETGYGIAPYVVDHCYGNKMVHIDYRGVSELSNWRPQVDYEYGEGEWWTANSEA